MRHLSTVLKAVGAVAVLGIVGNSVSLAATGQGLVLGKGNKADSATTIQRTTPGPALAIRTKRTTDAPFSVNGRGWIQNLNADTLDGLDSSLFTRATTTAALTGRVASVEATANSAASQASSAASQASTAQAGVNAIAPQLPIAQARIAATGVFNGRGVSGVTVASPGVFHVTLTQAPNFTYMNYVIQATPISSGCRVYANSISNKLFAATTDNAGAPVANCQFYITVTPL